MSTWRFILSLFVVFKWPLILEFIAYTITMVLFEQFIGLMQREIFNNLTGDAETSFGLWTLCVILITISVARATALLGTQVLNFANQFTMAALIRRNLFSHIIDDVSGPDVLPKSAGEAISRFRGDALAVIGFLLGLKTLAAKLIFAVVAVVIMTQINPLITAVAFMPLLAIMVVVNRAQGRLQEFRKASRQAAGDVTGYLGEMFGSIEVIKVANAEDHLLSLFRRINTQRKQASLRDTLLSQTLNAIYSNIQNVGTGIILIVAAQSMGTGDFTVGDLSLFIFYLYQIQFVTTGFGRLWAGYKQTGVSLHRLLELVPAVKPEKLSAGTANSLFRSFAETRFDMRRNQDRLRDLTVHSLGYAYPGSQHGINDISFGLKPGMVVVIAGRIGAGKTTLLRTLLGSLPRDDGEIRWNGKTIASPSEFLIPPRCGYIPQVPRLFSDTVRSNILMGVPETAVDLNSALNAAVLEQDMKELEHGLETTVGPRGVKLSGGQQRRVSAARLFVRDVELMVIDDLSGGLDVETERALFRRLLQQDLVAILAVTDNRFVLERADHIIVLKEGKLDAEGNLEDVLRSSNDMRQIWQARSNVTAPCD